MCPLTFIPADTHSAFAPADYTRIYPYQPFVSFFVKLHKSRLSNHLVGKALQTAGDEVENPLAAGLYR